VESKRNDEKIRAVRGREKLMHKMPMIAGMAMMVKRDMGERNFHRHEGMDF
jgi:hypothetical protein